MKKSGTYSLLILALAMVLSACMAPGEKAFRSMSAVSQMEDIRNIRWSESGEQLKVDYFASFDEEPVALYHANGVKETRCGAYAIDVLKNSPFFNMHTPIIYLPGLEQWNIEKLEDKENTFRLTKEKQIYTIDVVFDQLGRISSFKLSSPDAPDILSVEVKMWKKIDGKTFPVHSVVGYANRKTEWKYSDWAFNLPADKVQKIIEDNKKQSNNKNVKEWSNP